ncbi:DNA-binding response regulator [Boudabousia liubingyangii]|uniref:LuxR C-terminal-related transcriptional regulator n=1 Tax=Boudabousia liubingyangii TaxID=1921764 RepID=UPI00093BEF70|nr:response regulator transcription factor [Boudabousia liubingyangii]OKL46515.1 DNA-binding response regulator [Boudabousia liubingyangii]
MDAAATEPSGGEQARPLRLVLVDDHPMFLAGVRGELDPSPEIEICGTAKDVDSAIEVIRETQPDVVLLDVHLPGGNGGGGIEVARAVLGGSALGNNAGKAPRILALSVSDAAEDVVGVIRAGARGYVTKSISTPELLDAIKRVAAGDAAFSPRLAGFVLDAFGAAGDTQTGEDELDSLSSREREVMRYIARGYTYKEAAQELFISVKTIETHMSSVLRKLQLSNRNELTRWAAERHII